MYKQISNHFIVFGLKGGMLMASDEFTMISVRRQIKSFLLFTIYFPRLFSST